MSSVHSFQHRIFITGTPLPQKQGEPPSGMHVAVVNIAKRGVVPTFGTFTLQPLAQSQPKQTLHNWEL